MGHLGHVPPPFELQKISHMAINATLEKLPQWKITKIVATRCQILRLKCTKFCFGWGSAKDPAMGAYSAAQTSLAGFRGSASKGRKEKGGRGKGKEGRGGKEMDAPPFQIAEGPFDNYEADLSG